jgi:hypothetical protein
VLRDVDAAYFDRAAVDILETRDGIEQCGLAAT